MYSKEFLNLRREYLKTQPSSFLQTSGQRDLLSRLEEQKKPLFAPALGLGFAFALLLIFCTAVIGVSQSAKPGEALYSVKILSDRAYTKVTGDFEPAIDRRVEEMIEAKDEPNGEFDEVAKQYQLSIEEAKNKSKDSKEDKKEQFRRKLEEQEKKLQEISNQNPKLYKKLQEVVERTRKTRGEVKGEKDKNDKSDEHTKQKDTVMDK